jgi:hypothetical protein
MGFKKGQPNPGRKFKPGQSGNPSGYSKAIVEVAHAAREHTREAIDTLARIMRDEKATASARVGAAAALLDRGWGKAQQNVSIHHSGDMRNLTDAELLAIAMQGAEPTRKTEAPPDDKAKLN